jgi:hypothetical protein
MNLTSMKFFMALFNHAVCKIGLITYSSDAGRMSSHGSAAVMVLSTLLTLSFL